LGNAGLESYDQAEYLYPGKINPGKKSAKQKTFPQTFFPGWRGFTLLGRNSPTEPFQN
jgi:hypothetical protein